MSGSSTEFPTIYSTLAPWALVSLVLSQYNIPTIETCQLWHRGLSDIYLVETNQVPYILRVSHHHWRSQSEIEFELELLDFLRQQDLPVAFPLRTKEGQLSVAINAPEGERYAALFTYAPGKIALGDLNPNQSHKLGETVARLHQVTADFHPRAYRQSLTLDYLLDDSYNTIAPFLQHRRPDLQELTATITRIKEQLQHFPQKSPFWVICWGDAHSGNAHFTPEGQVTLFDFDQCGYGWRAFEIAKFWQVAIRTGLNRKVRDAFLGGYQTVAEITTEELSALQAFTQVAHVWMWGISLNAARIFNYSGLDDAYLTKRLEQLKMLKCHDWQLF